jgi:hypothetical protein
MPSRLNRREIAWVLKNSLVENALKNRRARMPYKRRPLRGYTFKVTDLRSDVPQVYVPIRMIVSVSFLTSISGDGGAGQGDGV